MKIGKSIFSIIMAACIMFTTVSMDMPLAASATETEMPEELMALDGTMVLAGDESNITISRVTTAGTYYSANGKCPMYIEYTTTDTLTNEQRNWLELKVTKEDGVIYVCTQKSDISRNSFSIIDCMNVENGNTYNLIFTITYNKPGEEKELWSETRTVSFEEKKEWASCNYFPAEGKFETLELYIPQNEVYGFTIIDEVYLFDKDGNIAAKSVQGMPISLVNFVAGSEDPRYRGVFSDSISFIEDMDMYIGICSFYRVRKLKEDEKLYVGYNLGGTIYKLEDVILTVTSKPYITSISYLPRDFQGNLYYDFIGINDIYAGADNANVIDLSAYNTDFSKLSVELQDKNTKETAGVSTGYTQLGRGYALYNIQWKDGKQPEGLSSYNVVYNYNGSSTGFVTEGEALSCYTSSKSENIMWNPIKDSIEYYNKDMPAGSLVSYEVKDSDSSTAVTYASGECTVNNSHLITVPLQEISAASGSGYLTVTYTDNTGNIKTVSPRNVEIGISKTGACIYSCYLAKETYLSGNGDIELSVIIHCKDKSKLISNCSASISNTHTSADIDSTELTLKNEDGRLVYKGTCTGLDVGSYNLSFAPDGKNKLYFNFFIEDSNRLCLQKQINNLDSGKISIYFDSAETAEWYCGEENSKIQDNLKIKILDAQENEIGIYKQEDFVITGEGFYRDIQFTEDVMKQLAGINYCYVYLYYGDGSEKDTIALDIYYLGSDYRNNFYDKELLYENSGVYVSGDKENGWLCLGISGNNTWTDWGLMGGHQSLYGKCNSIFGTKSAFPAVITITDWYSMEVIKKITVNEPGHIFTESEFEELSPTKLYNCYLQGADGTVGEYLCYLGEYDIVPDDKEEENTPDTGDNKNEEDNSGGEDNKADEDNKTDEEDKTDNENNTDEDTENNNPEIPETKPTKAPNNWYGWIGTSGGNSSADPTIKPEETPQPSQTPEASPSPVPTPKATIKPEVTVTPESTAEPVPTVQPGASTPPLDNKEPDKADNPKWNTVDTINEWKLSLKKKKIKLKKGQKAKIKITSELNTKVVYKSLKPSVATVNKNGIVTAKKAGKAVITVKANGKVCKVTVTVKGTVKETSKYTVKIPTNASVVKLNKNFKLAETKVILKKGKKLVIQKAAGISGKVTFISLDKKIASVSVNGVIKAKKKGKTTILIKKGTKTIKLKITVKN